MARYAISRDDEAFVTAREVMDTLMRERGVTEVQLAEVLGLAQTTVSDRRRGRSPLTLADIRRLALFFGVSPADFFPSSPSASSNATNELIAA